MGEAPRTPTGGEKVSAIAMCHKQWGYSQQSQFSPYFCEEVSGHTFTAARDFTVKWIFFYNDGTAIFPMLRCVTDGTTSSISGSYTFVKGKRYQFYIGENIYGTGNGYHIFVGSVTN